ncbi:MAG: hypothetical protein KAS07_05070 [Candidatus Pacebacteria bacterium]|nr:hypothetical protein [Candidatus Paceibacterota bacterium]
MTKQGITAKEIRRIIVNPYYAIDIHPGLFDVGHPKLVDRKTWVKSNMNSIKGMGARKWLETLLDVLEGNYVASDG